MSVYLSSIIMAMPLIARLLLSWSASLCVLGLAYLEIKRGQEEGTRTRDRARLLLPRDREKTKQLLTNTVSKHP